MSSVKVYSAIVCPYAQRSRMALMVKGVEFELIEVDLKQKPDWFLEVSPYGKVPVVLVDGDRVWESSIINEYLEEKFPDPPLLPKDPGQRAIARIWIDFANTKFTPAFYKLLLSQEPQQRQDWAAELTQHLLFMEREGLRKLSPEAPFWLGDRLSLVDLSYYPWFERWSAIAHYREMQLPDECDRLRQWWETMETLEVVKATKQSPDYHIQQYARYADNTADGTTAKELRRY